MQVKQVITAIVLGCLLAACGDHRSSAERFAEDGILVLGNNSEPQSQDPHKATSVADGKIISTLLEGLVRPSPSVDGDVLPGVADSWEHNEQADVWTFHLNPDVRWSDGRKLTAGDFVYAYQRLLHPEFAGKYAEMLYPLLHAESYNKGNCDWDKVGVKAIDDHTLQLTLSGPAPHLLRLLLHFTWFPVPSHKVEELGGMLDRRSLWTRPEHWVGNGAYVLAEHRFNDFLSVKPNPHYHRSKELRNRGIRFLPIVNGYTETRMYLGGKLHISNNVPPEMLAYAREIRTADYCQDPYYCTVFYRLNTTRPPLNDARVRRALHLAIDREALVSKVVRGAGKPTTCFTPPGAGYAATVPTEPSSRQAREELARQLLAEAGFAGGKGFPILELMTTSRDVQRVMAETIQSMWEKVLGIHVDIRSCEWTAYKSSQQNMDYDISSSSWSGDYLDPATFVELWRGGGGNNCTGWGNDEFDSCLANARRTGDADLRRQYLQRAEECMLQAYPILPLYHSERTYLRSSRHVRGWQPRLLDNFPLDAVEVIP